MRLGLLHSIVACCSLLAAYAEAQGPATNASPFIVRYQAGIDELIPLNATITALADGFGATEGPLWMEGKLWVSDTRTGDIVTLSPRGAKTVFARLAGGPIDPQYSFGQGPNGLAPGPNGSLYVARQSFRDIGIFRNGRAKSLVGKFKGMRFNAPNDLVVAPDGAVWFTDPTYSLPGGVNGPNRGTPFQGVFRYKNGRTTAPIVDIAMPNGIAFAPDGKTLYVSNTSWLEILAYDVGKGGAVANKRVIAKYDRKSGVRGVTDGFKVDARGNIWTSVPGAVEILAPDGKALGRLDFNGMMVSNVAFGGLDGTTLFITGGTAVYAMPTLVTGVRMKYAR